MLKNCLLNALRTFRRNKIFSGINILGLSIGISASLVIFLIASYEFSFDRFEKNRERIFEVVLDANFSGTIVHAGAVPAPLGKAIQNEVTGVELTVPVFQFQGDGNVKVSVPGIQSDQPVLFKKQPDVIFTNAQYFHLLSSYKWITGSPEPALKEPFCVVLTESRARLYFPTLSPDKAIGRQITYNDNLRVTVSGVVRDLHEHTDFAGAEFISLATIEKTNLQDNFMMNVWNDWMAYSKLYVKLAEGSSKERTETKLATLFKKYGGQGNHENNTISFRLLPLQDVHFSMDYHGFGQRIVSKPALFGLLAIAGFLLLLASINFINLSTAQSTRRAKEIGIRKTLGGSRPQLIWQFLSETFLVVTISTLLSVLFAPLLLKGFSDFIPPGLHAEWLQQPGILVFLILLIVSISILAGLYPAFVLSGFNPTRALKNRGFANDNRTMGTRVRKALTVSQFVIAQFFTIATLLVSKQIHYSLNQDLGFRKESILTFDTDFDTAATRRTNLLNEIKAMPEVEMVSTGFLSPGDEGNAMGANIQFNERPDIHTEVAIRWGDSNYINLYQIKILAGRNVRQSDTASEVMINETYANLLGFRHPEDILNKQLTFNGKTLPIVGVMGDFHEESMHKSIQPLAFTGMPGSKFHVRLRPAGPDGKVWKRAIGKIQKAFGLAYPDADFQYSFVDDTIAKWYQSEQNTSRLLYWATALTILISCLGLLGLVIYTTNTRAKEIGVRKILGASVTSILSVLSKEFIRLVLLAFLLAAPIAWWAGYQWLERFAYRTPMSWWVFAVSGSLLVLFALITLSIQTIRAAIANPVKGLRAE